MITYIYIFFLPGAAGSFFSRCLSMASNRCVGQLSRSATTPYLSLDKKFQQYQYLDTKKYQDWVAFEKNITHYSDLFQHHALNAGSVSIWNMHPTYEFLQQNIQGPTDRLLAFYIDPSCMFEWCMLNALHKDSYIHKKWIMCGRQMLSDPNIHKINLIDIWSSAQTLLQAVKTVCDLGDIDVPLENQQKIEQLWNQWIFTTLSPADFATFKRDIGYFAS